MKRLFTLALVMMTLFLALPSATRAGDADALQALYDQLYELLYGESIGTVTIVKTGYMDAYTSNDKKSGIVFRVHRGERFLCKDETDNGWYGIQFVDGTIGYVSQEGTALERGVADAQTLSTVDGDSIFTIKTVKRATVYSQPRARAQSKRDSGGSSSTFYFNSGTQLNSFGKTHREGKDWYVLYISGQGGNNVPEIVWLLASECEVVDGDPDANIIPSWWYDFD